MRQGLLFSIIVSIIVCAPALAYDWSTNPGDGSPENPYQISTAEQLNAIGADTGYMYLDPTLWTKHFKLMNDIDMSALGVAPHNMIGNRYDFFTGVFDGNRHVISNLRINLPGQSYVGLFGAIVNAEIKNLGLENVYINGMRFVGGLAGYSGDSTIQGCYTTGTVRAFSSLDQDWIYCGGLIGENSDFNGNGVINCHSSCNISSNGKGIGGLIGIQWGGVIAKCYATGDVAGYSYVGGLVGTQCTVDRAPFMGFVEECFSTGNVTGNNRLGGLVGEIGSAIIRNSYSTGSVSGNSVIGGLTGCVYFYPYGGHADAYVEKSYSIGKVTGGTQTGGLVGRHWNQSMKVYNSFWDKQTSGWTYSSGGTSKTTAQMQTKSTFTSAGWDLGNTWHMLGYPVLQWEISPLQALIDAAQDGDVIVVEPGVYEGRLYFKGKNITLTSVDPKNPNVVANTVLQGKGVGAVVTFNGSENETCILAGFTITGGATDARGGGIAGNGTQAGIYHCTIENNSAAYGGGLDQCQGRIEKCIIRNNSATVNGGGLAVCGGVITNCLVYENTAGNYGGGLHYCNGTITNCTVSDNTAASNGGGLNNCNGIIANCIIWGNSIQEVFSCPGTTYCCYPGASGTGNIDTVPLFIDVAGGDYHLLSSSPCINAGNPNYVAEPNETDLDGNARIFGPMVDMGCYEFPNALSVADARADILVYAWIDGYALVGLDGTGSSDEDGDALTYSWYNDANELIATGAEPKVLFGVGQHEVTLIVSDGIWSSQPDTCTITVIEPFETTARMLPGVINLNTSRPELMGRIEFAGEVMPVLDPNQPMLLLVGDAEVEAQGQKLVYSEETVSWYLVGTFDSAAVIEAIISDSHGQAELDRAALEITLVTRFEAGQWAYGVDTVKVK